MAWERRGRGGAGGCEGVGQREIRRDTEGRLPSSSAAQQARRRSGRTAGGAAHRARRPTAYTPCGLHGSSAAATPHHFSHMLPLSPQQQGHSTRPRTPKRSEGRPAGPRHLHPRAHSNGGCCNVAYSQQRRCHRSRAAGECAGDPPTPTDFAGWSTRCLRTPLGRPPCRQGGAQAPEECTQGAWAVGAHGRLGPCLLKAP